MRYPVTGKLTPKQNYLLNRIPAPFTLKGYERPAEPPEVLRARKVIADWEAIQDRHTCKAKQRNEAIVRKAKESVYFDPPEKALRIVQQYEKLLKGCPI